MHDRRKRTSLGLMGIHARCPLVGLFVRDVSARSVELVGRILSTAALGRGVLAGCSRRGVIEAVLVCADDSADFIRSLGSVRALDTRELCTGATLSFASKSAGTICRELLATRSQERFTRSQGASRGLEPHSSLESIGSRYCVVVDLECDLVHHDSLGRGEDPDSETS